MGKSTILLILSIVFALTYTGTNCMYKLPFKCVCYPLFYTCGFLKKQKNCILRSRKRVEMSEEKEKYLFEKANLIKKFKSHVKLKNCIGSKSEEIKTLIKQLKFPENFTKLGGTIPSAVLFYGPSGTGKSTLIKGIVYKSDALIIKISHYELLTEENIFSAAQVIYKKTKKRVIILIQKIDEIEKESLWLKLQHEINKPKEGVHIFATAKKPHIFLSEKIKKIKIDLPKEKDREELLKKYFNDYKVDEKTKKEDLHKLLAKRTCGFSGALIKDIMEKAVEEAGKKKSDKIYKKDILSALEKTKKDSKIDTDNLTNLLFI